MKRWGVEIVAVIVIILGVGVVIGQCYYMFWF